MSFEALLSKHTIQPLALVATTGPALGIHRSYAPDGRTLACSVFPKLAYEMVQLLQRGMVIPHTIYFNFDPNPLNETYRVLWNGVILRLRSIPAQATDPSNRNRIMWVCQAEARSEDQPMVELQ